MEYIAGVEWREGDIFNREAYNIQACLVNVEIWKRGGYDQLAEAVSSLLEAEYPGRAYFIEVGQEDKWCQIFQPYGLPRVQPESS